MSHVGFREAYLSELNLTSNIWLAISLWMGLLMVSLVEEWMGKFALTPGVRIVMEVLMQSNWMSTCTVKNWKRLYSLYMTHSQTHRGGADIHVASYSMKFGMTNCLILLELKRAVLIRILFNSHSPDPTSNTACILSVISYLSDYPQVSVQLQPPDHSIINFFLRLTENLHVVLEWTVLKIFTLFLTPERELWRSAKCSKNHMRALTAFGYIDAAPVSAQANISDASS